MKITVKKESLDKFQIEMLQAFVDKHKDEDDLKEIPIFQIVVDIEEFHKPKMER